MLCRIAIYATGVIFFRGTHKVRDNFSSIFNYLFRGLGLRIRVRVWVMIRVWVSVRVSVVLWSGLVLGLGSELGLGYGLG